MRLSVQRLESAGGQVSHPETVLMYRHATTAWKGSVISTVAGIPRCSIITASCKLHDEQAPQSPRPLMITWARTAMTSASSAEIT